MILHKTDNITQNNDITQSESFYVVIALLITHNPPCI